MANPANVPPYWDQAVEWAKATGFVPTSKGSDDHAWERAWSNTCGFDSVLFRMLRVYDGLVDVAIFAHASGMNPGLSIGTCKTLEQLKRLYHQLAVMNYDDFQAHRQNPVVLQFK